MTHYRIEGTTRGHGLAAGIFASLLGAMMVVCLFAFHSGKGEDVVVYLVVVPILVICVGTVGTAIKHIVHPQSTFVEITDESLSWRDWGDRGMQEMTYPIAAVKSAGRPGDDAHYVLILNDGTAVVPPMLVIPDIAEFNRVLTTVAPQIERLTY